MKKHLQETIVVGVGIVLPHSNKTRRAYSRLNADLRENIVVSSSRKDPMFILSKNVFTTKEKIMDCIWTLPEKFPGAPNASMILSLDREDILTDLVEFQGTHLWTILQTEGYSGMFAFQYSE